MKNILSNLTTTDLATLKKLSVSITDNNLKSPVSILHVTLATVDYLKKLDLDYNLTAIVGMIRKNRETTTTIDCPEHVTFNPELKVVGTNPRLFPVYFKQFAIDKLPKFIDPENATPETLTTATPAIIVETAKPKTTTAKPKTATAKK